MDTRITRLCHLVGLLLVSPVLQAADDDVFTFLQADRFEYSSENSALVWDVQGFAGNDYHKIWTKLEGEREAGVTEDNEVQLLYSRAWSPFFDWQVGLRHTVEPAGPATDFVIGVQGLAPQWFEIDAALFLSEDGDLGARAELEYEWLLTQRLILQPRLEFELGAQSNEESGLGSGLRSTELGLRLRYEWRRKFAPYIGVSWNREYGETADLARGVGESDGYVTWLAGVRLWF